MDKPIWGKWADDHDSGDRDMGSASLAAARPTAQTVPKTEFQVKVLGVTLDKKLNLNHW